MTTPIFALRQTTHMKKISIIVAGALMIVATQLTAADTLTDALQKGLFEEEANQNLEAAIKAYQDVLSHADEQRRVAATALFRLAECYRKQGKTNEAAGEYRRLLRDYTDQTTLANLSRQNLTGLGVSAPAVATLPSGDGSVASTDEEEKEIRRIKALIKDSPDLINARNQEIYRIGSVDNVRVITGTVLHQAAYKGHLQVARYLLDNAADVNAISSEDLVPLYYAAQNGHRNMTELLLAKGASPNFGASTSYRGTALHVASSKGFRAVAEVLFAHKADVNAKDSAGKTPLHNAVEGGFLPVAEFLIARGADVNATYIFRWSRGQGESATRLDIYDGTPLHFAVQKANPEMTQLLLKKGASVEARSGAGLTPLHYVPYSSASKDTKAALANLLLESKANVNAQGSSDSRFSGWTALHMALFHRATNLVQLFLDKGADPNLVMENPSTLEYRTALHNAVEYGYVREAELLLKHKADVNAPDFHNNTPLIRATGKNDAAMVELLLAHEADLKAVDENGNTALAWAVQKDQLRVADLLLAKGADPNGVNGGGASLLYVAMGAPGPNQPGLGRPLPVRPVVPRADSSAKPEPKPNKTMVELLIDYKADVNAPVTKDATAFTALQHVVMYRMTNWVRLFLEKGGNPNIPYENPEVQSRTPLQVAVEQKVLAIAEILLSHNADVNGLDAFGQTPLLRAINKSDPAMVELLLRHNADVAATTSDGSTPLSKAVEYNNVVIAEQLLAKGANPNATNSAGYPLLHAALGAGRGNQPQPYQPYGGIATSVQGFGTPPTANPVGVASSIPSRVVRPGASRSEPKSPSKPDKTMIELLLENKADPNVRDKDGNLPLHVAEQNLNTRAMELLLAHKADPNLSNDAGSTPLHWAVNNGAVERAELLLVNKANPNAADRGGATPLHWLIRTHTPLSSPPAPRTITNVAAVLLKYGADVNACNGDGQTPLHALLSESGIAEDDKNKGVQFLLEHGADMTQKCDGKPSAFEYGARYNSSSRTLELLQKYYPKKLARINLSGPVNASIWFWEADQKKTLSDLFAALQLYEKANPRKISVLRDDPNTGLKGETAYDLVAIRTKQAPDVPLRDGDKIIVAER
jgi:ankyrin repeat protein